MSEFIKTVLKQTFELQLRETNALGYDVLIDGVTVTIADRQEVAALAARLQGPVDVETHAGPVPSSVTLPVKKKAKAPETDLCGDCHAPVPFGDRQCKKCKKRAYMQEYWKKQRAKKA